MDKAIKKTIKESESKDFECLLDNAEKYLKTETNLFFAELLAKNASKVKPPKDFYAPQYNLDILDRLGVYYYKNMKRAVGNIKNDSKINRHKFILKFIKQKACAYCKSTIIDLIKFYMIKKPKGGRGLCWEINRSNPNKSYNDGNYEFICCYCNNAKSDVFTKKEFCKTIGPAIGRTIKDALKM